MRLLDLLFLQAELSMSQVTRPLVSNIQKDGFVVARIEPASLTNQLEIDLLRRELESLLHESDLGLVVDCSMIERRVSSEFLGVLVALAKQAARSARSFSICNLSKLVDESCQLVRLPLVVPTYDNVADAVLGHARYGKESQSKSTTTKRLAVRSALKAPTLWVIPALCVAALLTAVAFVIFSSQKGATKVIAAAPPPSVFQAEIRDTIRYELVGERRHEVNGYVIGWRDGEDLSHQVSQRNINIMALGSPTIEQNVFVTAVRPDGSYRLLANGVGSESGIKLLFVSEHVQATDDAPPPQVVERVLKNPNRFLQRKRCRLEFVYVRSGDPPLKHDVMFSAVQGKSER